MTTHTLFQLSDLTMRYLSSVILLSIAHRSPVIGIDVPEWHYEVRRPIPAPRIPAEAKLIEMSSPLWATIKMVTS